MDDVIETDPVSEARELVDAVDRATSAVIASPSNFTEACKLDRAEYALEGKAYLIVSALLAHLGAIESQRDAMWSFVEAWDDYAKASVAVREDATTAEHVEAFFAAIEAVEKAEARVVEARAALPAQRPRGVEGA